jgi:hypothetical protein
VSESNSSQDDCGLPKTLPLPLPSPCLFPSLESHSHTMANSRYAYVRSFEIPDPLLPSTFFIIRLDGKGFHAFSKAHDFEKPNDSRALELMNRAAKRVMEGFELKGECVCAIGESDEYS